MRLLRINEGIANFEMGKIHEIYLPSATFDEHGDVSNAKLWLSETLTKKYEDFSGDEKHILNMLCSKDEELQELAIKILKNDT